MADKTAIVKTRHRKAPSKHEQVQASMSKAKASTQ